MGERALPLACMHFPGKTGAVEKHLHARVSSCSCHAATQPPGMSLHACLLGPAAKAWAGSNLLVLQSRWLKGACAAVSSRQCSAQREEALMGAQCQDLVKAAAHGLCGIDPAACRQSMWSAAGRRDRAHEPC